VGLLTPGLGLTNPCEDVSVSKATSDLYERLEKTVDPDALTTIITSAQAHFLQEDDINSQACTAYVTGSAYLIQSSARAHRVQRALKSTQWFAKSQALNGTRMQDGQAQGRMRAAWTRLGRQKGWLTGRRLVSVTLPSGTQGDQLILRIPTAYRSDLCKRKTDCAAQWTVPLSPRGQTEIQLRPGTYEIGLMTPCGTRTLPSNFVLTGGELPKAPSPVCAVQLKVQHNGERLKDWRVFDAHENRLEPNDITSESGTVTVRAKGMKDQRIELDRQQTRVVPMKKCLVNVQAVVTPKTAKVSGAGVRPWGEFTLLVEHPGYRALRVPVDLPAPESCADIPAIHPVEIELERHVTLHTVDDRGQGITDTQISLGGAPRNPLGFSLTIGRHSYLARHAKFGTQRGEIDVTHCRSQECSPVVLTVVFESKSEWVSSLLGPNSLYIASGVLLISSGIMGWDALSADQRLETYTTKRDEGESVQSLIDRRNRSAFTSDILLLSSGISLASAYLWSRWGNEE